MAEDKVIRNGRVAVCISGGYGAGWTTWNSDITPFEPKVVEMIEANRQKEIDEEWCEKNLGKKNIYCGGASQLHIEWVDDGTPFRIDEYDGSESLITENDFNYTA